MEDHHVAWLTAHPHRSAEWLQDMLRDGFDVHHIDGDHGNNMPSNLVLIEHTDHMALHHLNMKLGRLTPKTGPRGPRKKKSGDLAEARKHSKRAAHAYRVYDKVQRQLEGMYGMEDWRP